jgi:histidinol-phosphate/aromatic aminotransferase/cobyric acid decarboxylase-like protein
MPDINSRQEEYKVVVPYSSARDEYKGEEAIFLDANENPFNSPLNRYPDPQQEKLKERISAVKSIPPGNIFLGNGSDEAIDLLIRAFCEPGRDNIISIKPTYGMYKVCADVNNVEFREALLTAVIRWILRHFLTWQITTASCCFYVPRIIPPPTACTGKTC